VNSNFLRLKRQKNKCNSMASSISSVSSTSNGCDHTVATEGDLLADGDSMACHQSDMPFNNDNTGSKLVLFIILKLSFLVCRIYVFPTHR
jgi:mediator of RNA polymerase II transcription subunit 13